MTFKDIFPGLSRTLSFNSRDFPGPNWFSRTFQVLEYSRKKSRTFQEAWEPCRNRLKSKPFCQCIQLVLSYLWRSCMIAVQCSVCTQKHEVAPSISLCLSRYENLWCLLNQKFSQAGLAINRSQVRILVSPLSSATLGKLTHVCLCRSPSSIIWYQPMGGDAFFNCGWEGNRRSGVALATRHRH